MPHHPTSGPDRTTNRILQRLQDLVPVAYALAGAVADRPEDTAAPHRRQPPGSSPPANLHAISVQQDLDRQLNDLHRRARHALGWADQMLNISAQTGVRCPHCRQLTLLANLTCRWIRCTNDDCRATPDAAYPPSWHLDHGLAAGTFDVDLDELPFNVEDAR